MRKRPLLRVSILCETPLDLDIPKKLFKYFKPYELAVGLYISTIHPTRKVIPTPSLSWNPILDTEFSYFMKTQEQLYDILITLIHVAIGYLNQTEYHSTGNTLTIFVPSTPNDNLCYTFGWRLDY